MTCIPEIQTLPAAEPLQAARGTQVSHLLPFSRPAGTIFTPARQQAQGELEKTHRPPKFKLGGSVTTR